MSRTCSRLRRDLAPPADEFRAGGDLYECLVEQRQASDHLSLPEPGAALDVHGDRHQIVVAYPVAERGRLPSSDEDGRVVALANWRCASGTSRYPS